MRKGIFSLFLYISFVVGFQEYNKKDPCSRDSRCIEEQEEICRTSCDCDGNRLCLEGKCKGTDLKEK